MALDRKQLARARARLEARRTETAARQERLEQEIFARVPELRRTEGELRSLLGSLVRAAAEGGPEAAGRVAELDERTRALCARRAALLRAHGYAPDALDGTPVCQDCGDTGYLSDGSPCACLLALYREERNAELRRLAEAGAHGFDAVELRWYRGADRENMEINLTICRDFVGTFGPDSLNLLFQGGTGLGKTLLSRCVAAAVAEAGFPVVYETAQDAFTVFETQKFSRDAESYHAATERVDQILDCDLLILDDLGTELTTSFTQSALYYILDTRLNRNKKTIISTNLDDRELARRYLPQIVSRINGEYHTLLFRGEDIRAQRKRERYL